MCGTCGCRDAESYEAPFFEMDDLCVSCGADEVEYDSNICKGCQIRFDIKKLGAESFNADGRGSAIVETSIPYEWESNPNPHPYEDKIDEESITERVHEEVEAALDQGFDANRAFGHDKFHEIIQVENEDGEMEDGHIDFTYEFGNQLGAESFNAEVGIQHIKDLGKSFDDDDGLPEDTYSATWSLINEGMGSNTANEWSRAVDATNGKFYLQEPHDFGPPPYDAETFEAQRKLTDMDRDGNPYTGKIYPDHPNLDPVRADRNNDGYMSSWERALGNQVAMGMERGGYSAESFHSEGTGSRFPWKTIIAVAVGVFAVSRIKNVEFKAEGGCGCGCSGGGGCGDKKSAEGYPEVYDPVADFLPRYRYPADSVWSNDYNPADPYRALDYQTIHTDSNTKAKRM